MSEYGKIYLKIVVLGESGVGKTALIQRFVDDTFSDAYCPTLGVEFYSKDVTINGRLVTFQLWDFSGDKDFSNLLTSYGSNADCSIIVYDVTKRDSFDRLNVILMQFLAVNENIKTEMFPFALIGNKIDLDGRDTPIGQALDWCSNNHYIPYFETTAKEGSYNVRDIFYAVAKIAMKNMLFIEKGGDPGQKIMQKFSPDIVSVETNF